MQNQFTQVAGLVGKTKEHVWAVIAKFTPQLDELQQKDETINDTTPSDPGVTSNQYWRRVANNLNETFESRHQVIQTTSK